MDRSTATVPTISSDRRKFLKGLVALGGGLALGSPAALACLDKKSLARFPRWHAKRFSFSATGTGDFDHVIGYRWPVEQLGPKPALEAIGDCFTVNLTFPYAERDLLRWLIHAIPPLMPAPVLISEGLIEIEEITVGGPVAYPPEAGLSPKPTFALLGRIVDNAQESPFGPVVGRAACITGAFDHEGNHVKFYLLGTSVAGSHATFNHEAEGSIHFHGY